MLRIGCSGAGHRLVVWYFCRYCYRVMEWRIIMMEMWVETVVVD